MESKSLLAGVLATLLPLLSVAAQEPAAPSATPVEKRLAPPGVFFVLERLTTVTDSGIASAAPGTKVTLVRAGSPMKVTDGRYQYEALAHQVTNDLNVVDRIKQAAAAQQEAMRQRIAKLASQQPATPALASPPPVSAPSAPSGTPAPGNTTGQPSEAERQQQIAELRKKIKDIREEIQNHRSERTPIHVSRRGRITGGLVKDPGETQTFLKQKNKEIEDLKEQIRKLGGVAFE